MREQGAEKYPHTPACDEDGCYCPDDAFWGRLLGEDDPCAPGKDWVAAAFGSLDGCRALRRADHAGDGWIDLDMLLGQPRDIPHEA